MTEKKDGRVAQILSGKETAAAIIEKNLEESGQFQKLYKRQPSVCVVRIGARPDDLAYERGIQRNAKKAEIKVCVHELPEDIKEEDVISCISSLNRDPDTDGILLFLPIPKRFNERRIVNSIAPEKDIDGATDASKLGVYTGSGEGFPPCTAEAVMKILDYYQIPIEGRRAVVIGRSPVIGKPLSMMLLQRNATVTICHSRTRDLSDVTKEADILVSAAGRMGMVTRDHVRYGQTVIDVGINFNKEGKMTGDVVFDEVSPIVSAITPVPGGVGAVTTAVLLSHVLEKRMHAIENADNPLKNGTQKGTDER